VSDVTWLLVAIAASDRRTATGLLDATRRWSRLVWRGDEFFFTERLAQVYEGDTALHGAAFSYDPDMAREPSSAVRTSGPGTAGAPNRTRR
jgi:hypothetical protein